MGKPAEIKTKPISFSVASFIGSILGERKRKDSRLILTMTEKSRKKKQYRIFQGGGWYRSPLTAGPDFIAAAFQSWVIMISARA